MRFDIPGEEDRAVSPVIGVVLMVGVTVVLASTVHVLVLDYGDRHMDDPIPQAAFSLTVEGCGGDKAVVTHGGGQTIAAERLSLRSSALTLNGSWADPDGYETTGVGDGVVGSGDQALVCVEGHDAVSLRVIWTGMHGNKDAVLADWRLVL